MTNYTNPNPVTSLVAQWQEAPDTSNVKSGINLSWVAPTVTSGTIGGYFVYVLMYNKTTEAIDAVPFVTLKKSIKRDLTTLNSFSVDVPPTTTFFPFSWVAPLNTINSQAIYSFPNENSYSFQVVVFLLENDNVKSNVTSVTVYKPPVDDQKIPLHLNPRFSISTGDTGLDGNGVAATFPQDTYEEVASCVEMLLNTPKRYRSVVPEYGVVDPTFSTVDTNILKADLHRWEPRAEVDISIVMDDSNSSSAGIGMAEAKVNINIVSIKQTHA
jgi:hypothetical protein